MTGLSKRVAILAIASALAAILSACGSDGNPSPSPSASDSPSPIASDEPPAHNYSDRIKGVYYYVSAVSDNDKANGKASGDAIGFKFLGTNEDGEFILANVNSLGLVTGKAYCHNPCTVIRYSDGETAGFSPDSVIGAAFSDAFNGQLKEAGKN